MEIDLELTEKSAKNTQRWKLTATIVAVNFHQRWVFFADFSVNSESIFMKFYKHSFHLIRRLPWKFRDIWISISKVRPFDK